MREAGGQGAESNESKGVKGEDFMGLSIEVDSSSFAAEVLEKSYEKPVLVDFFAQWCGPCQMLKPMLEGLVKEYDFVLAKVDIDQSPDLANTYGVEGVPDVKIVSQGEVTHGFVGVLQEPQLRELLAQLNLKSELEFGLEKIQQVKATGDVETVKHLFNQLIERYPENRKLILEAARFLISQERIESAVKLLGIIQSHEKAYFSQAQGLQAIIQFKQIIAHPKLETELDDLYLKACQLAIEEAYELALSHFLEIVRRDRSYQDDGARKAMLALFHLLGDDHPLTKDYRKKLMQTLF